jgi:hypothetical protein
MMNGISLLRMPAVPIADRISVWRRDDFQCQTCGSYFNPEELDVITADHRGRFETVCRECVRLGTNS